MDEEAKKEFVKYFNAFAERTDTLEFSALLCVIEQARANKIDIPLDGIYDCIRKDYNAHTLKDTDDKTILYKYLKEKERYNLLNILILMIIKIMLEGDVFKDLFVLDDFELFNYIIMKESINLMNTDNLVNIDDIAFTKISDKEINNIIEDFLIKIDPTLEWLSIYKNAKDRVLLLK